MASVSTYLNFERQTEEAFAFYKTVFGTEYIGGIMRHSDVPVPEGYPGPAEEDKNLVINVQLPITGGHVLLGTDAPPSMGFNVTQGSNVHICINPDSREEADRLFAALSDGGNVGMPMMDQFWGDYFGSFSDKFGINWMINYSSRS